MSSDPSELMTEIGGLVADAIADGVLESATIERNVVDTTEPDAEWATGKSGRDITIRLVLAE